MSDLERLMLCPDKEQYQLKISWILIKDGYLVGGKAKHHQQKNRWVKEMPFLPILIPLILFWFLAFMSAREKMFAHIRNKYGEIGYPCLSPFLGVKDWVMLPFMRRVYWTEITHSMIHCTHLSLKFMARRIAFKKLQSTLSYALVMSIFRAPKHFFLPLFFPK